MRSFLVFGKDVSGGASKDHVSYWPTVASAGRFIGLGATSLLLALACALVVFGIGSSGISMKSIMVGLVGGCLVGVAWATGELTYAAFRMRYQLSEGKLTIKCGWRRVEVPLHDIKDILRGRDAKPPRRLRGICWPGLNLASGYVRGIGEAQFFSTGRFDELVLICVDRHVYAISPAEAEQFVAALRESCGVSGLAGEQVEVGTSRAILAAIGGFLADPAARAAFLGGLVLNVALFAVLALSYSRLPEAIPVHFNSLGQADIIGAANQIFKLPAIGLFVWVTDAVFSILLHRRERALCYLLLCAAVLVQVVLWGATAAMLM